MSKKSHKQEDPNMREQMNIVGLKRWKRWNDYTEKTRFPQMAAWKGGFRAGYTTAKSVQHSQPIADELALVKAERDELREALDELNDETDELRSTWNKFGPAYGAEKWQRLLHMQDIIRAILEKYPKP